MHESVEPVPALLQCIERGGDLRIVTNIHVIDEIRAKLRCDLTDAVAEALSDIGECQFGPLAPTCLRYAVGNRAIRKNTGDKQALAGQKPHLDLSLVRPLANWRSDGASRCRLAPRRCRFLFCARASLRCRHC